MIWVPVWYEKNTLTDTKLAKSMAQSSQQNSNVSQRGQNLGERLLKLLVCCCSSRRNEKTSAQTASSKNVKQQSSKKPKLKERFNSMNEEMISLNRSHSDQNEEIRKVFDCNNNTNNQNNACESNNSSPSSNRNEKVAVKSSEKIKTHNSNGNNGEKSVLPTKTTTADHKPTQNQANTTTTGVENEQPITTSAWMRNNNNNATGNMLQQRQKISLTRERKAARTLGIIMGAFTICWCPFFVIYLLQAFDFDVGPKLFEFLTWLGYMNSALNPIIYTIFNLDFRKSFERIIFGCILCKRRN